MINFPKSSKGLPLPDLGDVQSAFSLAQNTFAALSNHNQSGANISAAANAPYTAVNSAAITRKSSGIFAVWATVTISINGGNMAAADAVTYTGVRFPATHVGPVKTTAAISGATGAAVGYTVVADCNLFFIDTPGIAVGASTVYGLLITGVDLLVHTSGVIAASDGNIVVVELPG